MEKSHSASASPSAPLLIFAKTLLRQQEISPKKRFFAIGLQKNKAMTTLTLQFDNPSIMEHFKGFLSVMEGVRTSNVTVKTQNE